SNSHKKNKLEIQNSSRAIPRQQTITSLHKNISECQGININLVKTLVEANIPMEKIDSLKSFFKENFKEGGGIMGSNQLHEHYLPIVYEQAINKIMNEVRDKHICITVDETMDACGRSAVNILFSYGKYTKLVKTSFLEIVNYSTISQLIVTTINSYNIPYDRLTFLTSDSASYMLKAFRDCLSPLIPNLLHNTCFAHIFNLVGETWIDFDDFKILDQVVGFIKSAFVHSGRRKRRWLQHLTEANNSDRDSKLPPLPVKTCWNSWFNFVFWLDANFLHLFITLNARRLIQDLEFFKIHDKAIAPYVFLRIENTKNLLRAGIENPPLNQSMIDLCRIHNVSEESLIPTFSQAFNLAYNKLYKHVNRHSALPLFKEIQCFNPKFIRASSSQKNILLYSFIKEFINPEDELINEWSIYCGDNEFLEENLDLNKYWNDKQQILPLLSRIALEYIWLPVSGVDVE
ncbi:10976_t:CDS:2, partial [Entrophospora sp. SA101]